jgi:hypothetical protein
MEPLNTRGYNMKLIEHDADQRIQNSGITNLMMATQLGSFKFTKIQVKFVI